MWLGILTPGAHPSRETPTPEATVYCWTQRDRRKIDGPFAAVHGGLRVQDTALDEPAVIVVPGESFVVTTPLDHVPSALALLAQAAAGLPLPACSDCGQLLPGSAAQRAADERARCRRGATRRGGHGRRAA